MSDYPSEEAKLIAEEGYVHCFCGNAIDPLKPHCKYCKRFNAAGKLKACPTCGQDLVVVPKE